MSDLRLYRASPPAADPGTDPPRWEIAPRVRIVDGPPRRMDPPTVDVGELARAISRASREVAGETWAAPFEDSAGVRRASFRRWAGRSQIPPAAVVAWLA